MATANPFRFSTKYQDDETDLLYYGYRYFSASTGRWLSSDPVEEEGGTALYVFVVNDPISSVDLFGLKKTWQFNYNFGKVFIGGGVELDEEAHLMQFKGEFGGSFVPTPLVPVVKTINRALRRVDYELRLDATVSGSFHISIDTCVGEMDKDTKVCGNFAVAAMLRHQTRTPGGFYSHYEPFAVGAYGQGSLCVYLCTGKIRAEWEYGAFFQITNGDDTRWKSWRDWFNFQWAGSGGADLGSWSLPPSLFENYCKN